MAGRHAGGTSTGLRIGLAVLLVLLLGAGVTAAVRGAGGEPDDGPRTAASATAAPTTPAASPEPAPPPGGTPESPQQAVGAAARQPSPALARCARAVEAAEQALAAAEPGQRNWADHVQAYRDLVAGGARYGAAEAVWTRTRLAGPSDLVRFAPPDRRWLASRGACARLGGLSEEEQQVGRVCAARAAAVDAAVVAARTTLDQWRTHQQDMAQRRARQIGRAEARQRFRALVDRAPAALAAARDSASKAKALPRCPVAAGA